MKTARLAGHSTTVIVMPALLALAAIILIWLTGHQTEARAAGPADPISLEMHTIASTEPGINLSIREKHVAGRTNFRSDRVILLLEPFGVPAAEAFDTSIPEFNLMDNLARQGYDVWALDFRGFGASGRSSVFDQPMMANPPQERAPEAVKDVDAAMQYICGQRNVAKANVLGWSWGAVVASTYAGQHPEKLERLVVYGGMHAFLLPSMTNPMTDPNTGQMKPLPAYQFATPSMSINHWNMQAMGMVPHTPEAETELSRIFLASDATSGTRSPASIRRAMGPMVDLYEIWSGRPTFDASLITAPTLIIRGDHDTFSDDPGFMPALSNVPYKRYVAIPEATHWALYETGAAPTLMHEISRFLSSGRPVLELNYAGVFWANLTDYQNGLLNVKYRIDNHGTDTAYNLRITGSSATGDVTLDSTGGLLLGEIAGGASTPFTLRYKVPGGLSGFRATVNAAAEDGGGAAYSYPTG